MIDTGKKTHRRAFAVAVGAGATILALVSVLSWRSFYHSLVPEARLLGRWQVDTTEMTLIREVEFVPDTYYRRGGEFRCEGSLISLPVDVDMSKARGARGGVRYRMERGTIVYWTEGCAEVRRPFRVLSEDAIDIGGIKYRRVPVAKGTR